MQATWPHRGLFDSAFPVARLVVFNRASALSNVLSILQREKSRGPERWILNVRSGVVSPWRALRVGLVNEL